jgi:dTDP-4-dehydrorhamnose 3,5-epimerase
MYIETAAIPDVKIVHVERYADTRGVFSETYHRDKYKSLGIETPFVQDNQSISGQKGTVRGLHFQSPPFAQAKLVRVVMGAIIDIAVDLRVGSSTFGRHVAVELNADNGDQVFIPAEFAHGFCTLTPNTVVIYKTSRPYAKSHECGVLWNDPELSIAWPITEDEALLSDKDRDLPLLRDIQASLPFALQRGDAA